MAIHKVKSMFKYVLKSFYWPCNHGLGQPYVYYYTSEDFFLYKTTVDKWTIHHFSRQNELLGGT